MKAHITVFCLALLAVASGCRPVAEAPPAATEPAAPESRWDLVWADEFDGAQLDRESWTVEMMPDPFNEELQFYPDRTDDHPDANIWLEDGVLIIEARREDYEHRRYTSGRIKTQGKREFLYGRFEARMRLPEAVGTWPAFWLLGGNIETVGWPACGEIDIMEGKGRLPRWTSGALHAGPDPASNRILSAGYDLPSGDFQSEWHVFAVEWEPEQIRWCVDDAHFYTVAKPAGEDPAYWPFDHGQPFFILLNLAVGGWFDNPHQPPEDMSPQRLEVDYVRVFRAVER